METIVYIVMKWDESGEGHRFDSVWMRHSDALRRQADLLDKSLDLDPWIDTVTFNQAGQRI